MTFLRVPTYGVTHRSFQGLGPDIISPVYTSDKRNSPADEEIIRLQSPVRMPVRHIDGVELSPHEYHRYVALAGNEAKRPDNGIRSERYPQCNDRRVTCFVTRLSTGNRWPRRGKSLLIRRLVVGFREQAKAQLMKEKPN